MNSEIFVVDDEPRMCRSLKFLLERHGYQVETAFSGSQALATMSGRHFDLFLVNIGLPGMDGFQLVDRIRRQDPQVPVVMITGDVSADAAVAALRKGACDYLRKPFDPQKLVHTVKAVIEKKRVEDTQRKAMVKLKSTEKRYRYMVESSPDLIYMLDRHGRFTFVNNAVKRLLGYDPKELIGQSYDIIIHEDDLARVRWLFNERRTGKRAAVGASLRLKCRQAPRSGMPAARGFVSAEIKATGLYTRPVSQSEKTFIGTYGVARDVGHRTEQENQVLLAKKMEAIGTLAGGLAHDFNNLLMGIQGYATLMRLHMDRNDPDYDRLSRIETNVQNGAELLRQLLSFTTRDRRESKLANLNGLVERNMSMLVRAREQISVRMQLESRLWGVMVDEEQISQVLLSLFVNAFEAMPEGGSLDIRTENAVVDEADAEVLGVHPGNYVKLTVADSGLGMDESTRQRIFDPFFTTKGLGRGTGLGLAVSYMIVKNHGGLIRVVSRKGRGSTFTIFLPASGTRGAAYIAWQDLVLRGTETILLVDHEEMIRDMVRGSLEDLGYEILTACNGQAGIRIYSREKNRIDLLILNMVLPDMGLRDFYEKIIRLNSRAKFIIAGVFSADHQVTAMQEHAGSFGYVRKPYDIVQLTRKIRDVIDGSETFQTTL